MLTITTDRYTCNRCNETKPASDFSEIARSQAKAGLDEAMCLVCVDAMFRSRTSTAEAAARLKEDTNNKLESCRVEGQEERKRKDLRWGHGLHSSEVIAKLRKLIPSLYVQQGNIPGDISLYDVQHTRINYLGYIHEGDMPEYDIILVDARNLPSGTIRGWRTILLRLIGVGQITEEQAHKEFGEPSTGEVSRFYNQELFRLRNTPR